MGGELFVEVELVEVGDDEPPHTHIQCIAAYSMLYHSSPTRQPTRRARTKTSQATDRQTGRGRKRKADNTQVYSYTGSAPRYASAVLVTHAAAAVST
eukprot:scaffold24152_cov146-Isochrysis_galbana.AAC.2